MNMKNNRDSIPDEILELIARKAANTISPKEDSQLVHWLERNPEMRNQYVHFLVRMQKFNWLYRSKTLDHKSAWDKINKSIYPQFKVRNLYLKWIAAAAIFVLFIAAAWYLVLNFQSNEPIISESAGQLKRTNQAILVLSDGEEFLLNEKTKTNLKEDGGIHITNKPGEILAYGKAEKESAKLTYHKLIIPPGARYQLQLSDGTQVWMNAASEIQYPVVFGNDERRIVLSGEAYFEVKEDSKRPFIIESNGYEIRVLGTSFNVSTYQNDTFMQTTLVNGEVEVTRRDGKKVMLEPGQMVLIDNDSQSQIVEDVDTRFYTSWKEGILYFNKVSLFDLSVKLGRWYDADFEFLNHQKKSLIYSGAMENSRNIGFILDLISQTADVSFSIEGKKVTVE
jgi:ferric-dicitrate binding protein FerR (iron transport regulator)